MARSVQDTTATSAETDPNPHGGPGGSQGQQEFGDDPIEVRDTDHYTQEYVTRRSSRSGTS